MKRTVKKDPALKDSASKSSVSAKASGREKPAALKGKTGPPAKNPKAEPSVKTSAPAPKTKKATAAKLSEPSGTAAKKAASGETKPVKKAGKKSIPAVSVKNPAPPAEGKRSMSGKEKTAPVAPVKKAKKVDVPPVAANGKAKTAPKKTEIPAATKSKLPTKPVENKAAAAKSQPASKPKPPAGTAKKPESPAAPHKSKTSTAAKKVTKKAEIVISPIKPQADKKIDADASKAAKKVVSKIELVIPPVAARPPVKKKLKPIGSAVVRGKIGRYDFEVFPLDAELKDGSAIYVISKRITDPRGRGHHKFVCIGQTESLLGDIKKHRKDKCIKQYKANVICLLREDSETNRLKIATDLREAHAIACNQK